MALHTAVSENNIFAKTGNVPWKHWGDLGIGRSCACSELLVFIEAEREGDFKALEIEVGVRGDGIATTESEVDIFGGIDDEVVNRVVAIKVEIRKIDATHVIDSSEDELGKELSAG